MGDHFFSSLPQGHAMRTMPLPATRALLIAKPAFVILPGPDAAEARRQHATIAWAFGAANSLAAVAAISRPARVYLVRLFGVAPIPSALLQVAARIDAHRLVHHP